MVRSLAEFSYTNSNIKWGGFRSQLRASYVSSRTEELWCYILTFDLAQKYYSKVIHRKEVTNSNGQ